jgi:hypothetical protein
MTQERMMAEEVSPSDGPKIRLFDISEYGRMLEGSFFDEDCRVDLVSGQLCRAETYSPRRLDAMERIGKLLRRQDDLRILVRVKNRIRFDWYTEMQPDIAVVQDYPKVQRLYSVAPPAPRDIIQIVEVVNDPDGVRHAWMSHVYAQHGIGSLWIVDLHHQLIVDYRVPEPDGYASVHTYSRGQSIRGLLSIDPIISVDEVLGQDSTESSGSVGSEAEG